MNYHFAIIDEEKYNITVDLSSFGGSADMIVKLCNTMRRFNCTVDAEEFLTKDTADSTGVLYRSHDYDKTHHFVNIYHDPE
jgi:hypothetical protein